MTKTIRNRPDEMGRVTVTVPEPSEDARRTVSGVLSRALEQHADERHERIVFQTPGVLEALDAALDEVAALKRSM